jgi:MFS superfamily sulfate permease-like transporter
VTASLSLAGVLTGAIGGFVLATMSGHPDRIQRIAGCTLGGVLIAIGIGLFVAGFFQ